MKVLVAYDGSDGADAAIVAAGRLLGGGNIEATVLSIWEPLLVEALRASRFGGRLAVPTDVSEIDDRSEDAAWRMAERGARLASEIGFEARPRYRADRHDIAGAILAEADTLDVDLIVLGTRGLTGVRAFLGSVSNHVLQHARRPLLIVPPSGSPHEPAVRYGPPG